MPKIVDHEERRKEVARVTFETMKEVGPERTTVREIARKGGFSPSALNHYFRNKEELYGFAYAYLSDNVLQNIKARAAKLPAGVSRLYASLEEVCPYNLGVGAAATLSFWSHVIGNPENKKKQRELYALWRQEVLQYIDETIATGEVGTTMPSAALADLSLMFLDGLCVAATLEPRRFPRKVQQEFLDHFFTSVFLPQKNYKP